MLKDEIIKSFVQLGSVLDYLSSSDLNNNVPFPLTQELIEEFNHCVKYQKRTNGWFTEENVRLAIKNHAINLTDKKLNDWQSEYGFAKSTKTVLVIMAGNIPLVGFHDFISVLMSGNRVMCKLSSDDSTLLPLIAEILLKINPKFIERISFVAGVASGFDAVIATGSNNTIHQFRNYFKNHPKILRKNRTSLAVIRGDEDDKDFQRLGNDIFNYFGLGCRNVAHLILPNNFDLNKIFKNITSFGDIIHHNKYANNYDYYRAIYMLNKVKFLENNFVIFMQSMELNSPVSVLNYHYYDSQEDIEKYLAQHNESIQVIIGKDFTNFGNSQFPLWTDYADKIDTMQFLLDL